MPKKTGIKSGIVRKEKANIKQALGFILSSKPTKPIQDVLIQSGITMPENTDMLEALIYLATIKATVENATLGQIIKFLEFFYGYHYRQTFTRNKVNQ